jgi:hypothetical protein
MTSQMTSFCGTGEGTPYDSYSRVVVFVVKRREPLVLLAPEMKKNISPRPDQLSVCC